EQVKEDDLVYVALGDSTAQAIGASKPEYGYVGLVKEYLENKTNKNVAVINISVSGAKLSDVIAEQIPKLKDLPKADVLTIEIGANDVINFNRKKFEKDFRSIAQ